MGISLRPHRVSYFQVELDELTQPIKGGPPSLCSQLLVDGLSGDGPVSKWGRNQERKGTIRSEGSNTTPRTERWVAAQVEGACGWAGWRPSPRGMGDGASLGTAPKPQRRWSQSGFCRSLRSPHEATWSPHVGTHQPEHALHIVRKTTVEAKLRSQFRGFLGSQKAICFLPTTRQPGECQLGQMTTKSKSSDPALTWEASRHLNHPFPTPESLSARWAASGGPTQKESTIPHTLLFPTRALLDTPTAHLITQGNNNNNNDKYRWAGEIAY